MNRARNNRGVLGMQNDMNGMQNGNEGRNLGGEALNNGNGMTYGLNPNGGQLAGTLAEQIRALGFVKNELELYLDTHPNCRTALDYYHRTIRELKRLTEEYENTTGPLTAMGNLSGENWQWVEGPWPWHQAGDFMREGNR